MGFVLGPILGLVTNRNARILFEVSSSGKYFLKYKKKSDDQYTVYEYDIAAGSPSVIHIRGLDAGTVYYYEIVDQVKNHHLNGSFQTLHTPFYLVSPGKERDFEVDELHMQSPEQENREKEKVHFISHNTYKHRKGAWNQLMQKPGYQIHIGNQVYQKHTKKELKRFLKDLSENDLEENREEIENYIRRIYRKTWNEDAKNSLHSTPNLMVGQSDPFKLAKKGHQNAVNRCAYNVFKDYQRSLRVNPLNIKDCDYFVMQMGLVGYLFLDEAAKWTEQINFFRSYVNHLSVKNWVVISQTPVFKKGKGRAFTDRQIQDILNLPFESFPLFIAGGTVGKITSVRFRNKIEGYQVETGGVQQHMPLLEYIPHRLCGLLTSCCKIKGYKCTTNWRHRGCNFVSLSDQGEDLKIHFTYDGDSFFQTV